jgi:hypothetical protein
MEHSTGNLKPGATYTYTWERGIVYAREDNQPRFIIGWKYVPIDTRSYPVEIDE